MSRSSNTFLAFLAGVTTGALLGVLFAPDKGSNTRDRLTYALDKYKQRLEDLLDDVINGRDEAISEARNEGKRVVKDAKEKAEKLLHDVDELIDQIKGDDK